MTGLDLHESMSDYFDRVRKRLPEDAWLSLTPMEDEEFLVHLSSSGNVSISKSWTIPASDFDVKFDSAIDDFSDLLRRMDG